MAQVSRFALLLSQHLVSAARPLSPLTFSHLRPLLDRLWAALLALLALRALLAGRPLNTSWITSCGCAHEHKHKHKHTSTSFSLFKSRVKTEIAIDFGHPIDWPPSLLLRAASHRSAPMPLGRRLSLAFGSCAVRALRARLFAAHVPQLRASLQLAAYNWACSLGAQLVRASRAHTTTNGPLLCARPAKRPNLSTGARRGPRVLAAAPKRHNTGQTGRLSAPPTPSGGRLQNCAPLCKSLLLLPQEWPQKQIDLCPTLVLAICALTLPTLCVCVGPTWTTLCGPIRATIVLV